MPLTIASLKSPLQWVAFQLLNPICGVRARPLSNATAVGAVTRLSRASGVAAAIPTAASRNRTDIGPPRPDDTQLIRIEHDRPVVAITQGVPRWRKASKDHLTA